MLTDLQRQIRAIVAELPEGAAVALAGGSALIATGAVRRGTESIVALLIRVAAAAPRLWSRKLPFVAVVSSFFNK